MTAVLPRAYEVRFSQLVIFQKTSLGGDEQAEIPDTRLVRWAFAVVASIRKIASPAQGVNSSWLIIFDTTPSVLLAEPIFDSGINTLVFHLKVRSAWIALASALALQTLDAIRYFECHNLFLRLNNFLHPELGWACGFKPGGGIFFTVQRCSDANQVTSGLEHPGGRFRVIPMGFH